MTVILVNRSEATKVENEEKINWVMNVLETMGIPIDNWLKEPTMDNLRQIRSDLRKLDIDIIDDSNGGIEIYFQGKLLGEWRRPNYVLKEDVQERNRDYRYYLEMHLNRKSVFD